jgi:SAM-dependent methyltransferase
MAKTWKTLLIYHIMEKEMARCAKTYLHGRLIDIGCGTKPYRKLIAPHVVSHIGLDQQNPFNPSAEVDIFGTAYDIPVRGGSFDVALSTAALEHLAEPECALRECNRILKNNGIAIYTVPFIWHLHAEPWDYYRFSKYGLQHIFEKAGFEIIEIEPMAGFWATSATMCCYYIERFHCGPLRFIPLIPIIGLLLQGVAYLLGLIDKAEQWTWMYTVVARKK